MRNKLITAVCSLLLVSCTQTFDITPSEITYLPVIKLEGDSFLDLSCTESFGSFGAAAFEGSTEIPVDVQTVGSYFGGSTVDGPDFYSISYSAINKDGIPGSAFRDVVKRPCTGDLVGDISGLYTSSTTRISGEAYDGITYVYIVKTGENTFALSHAIGGFYELGRGYGYGYSAIGAVITKAGDSYTSSGALITGFDLPIEVNDIVVDSGAKTISYNGSGNFGSGSFDVVLTLVE